MKVTLKALHSSYTALSKLVNEQALTTKQKYWLAKITAAADKEIQALDTARIGLVEKFDKEDPAWRDKEERLKAFDDEFSELLKEEVEMPRDPFKLTDLPEQVSLTVVDFIHLGWLIEE